MDVKTIQNSTRLFGFFLEDDKRDMSRQLFDHDDLDCLDDLEAAGYIKSIGTGLHPAYEITESGWKICGLLRKHKTDGKHYATFQL